MGSTFQFELSLKVFKESTSLQHASNVFLNTAILNIFKEFNFLLKLIPITNQSYSDLVKNKDTS
jgi:hypothetical protein